MNLPVVLMDIVRGYLMISTEEVRARRGLVFAEVCKIKNYREPIQSPIFVFILLTLRRFQGVL